MNRILDFSNQAARLSAQNHLLKIAIESGTATIPFADLAAVIVSHPAINLSKSALSALAENNVAFIVCDGTHKPSGMLLSLGRHSSHAETFAKQAAMGAAVKKQLWKQIEMAKIRTQAALLVATTGHDSGLGALLPQVRSGDTGNVEARAARI